MKIARTITKAGKSLKDYTLCTFYEADGKVLRMIPAARKILRARLRYDIGPVYYSLYSFSQLPEEEWPEYETNDRFWHVALKDRSLPEVKRIEDNKALFYQHCVDHGLPTIPIIGIVGDSPDHLRGSIPSLDSFDQWAAVLANADKELFVKPIEGSHGDGTFTVTRIDEQFEFEGVRGSLKDLHCHMLAKLAHDKALILQPRIRAHPRMLEISSAAGLSTARVVTRMEGGVPQILIACAKLPVGDSISDNFSNGRTGNLLAAIDLDTGRLSTAYGPRRTNWPILAPQATHPDTGRRIPGFPFPFWRDVKDIALRGQQSLPGFKSLGWDIAVTDEGVLIVEANGGYAIDILQVAHQRGLRREIISQVT